MFDTEPARAPLVIQAQGNFYIGGRDLRSDALSTVPAYAPSGTVAVDQVEGAAPWRGSSWRTPTRPTAGQN